MDLTVPVVLKNIPMTFEDYCARVAAEQDAACDWLADVDKPWTVPGSLRAKVDEEGALRPFFGDTVVMPASPHDCGRLGEISGMLHHDCGDLLARPLASETCHVTLHDLSSGNDAETAGTALKENQIRCRDIFSRAASYFSRHRGMSTVTLKAGRIYPCCNISVVMGFVPAGESDYRTIMNLYNTFDDVVYLDYWLRLHVTLAYFRPLPPGRKERLMLAGALEALEREDFFLTLDIDDLAYQHFVDMNSYETIFSLRGERKN